MAGAPEALNGLEGWHEKPWAVKSISCPPVRFFPGESLMKCAGRMKMTLPPMARHETKTVTESDSTPPVQPGKGTEYAMPLSAKL